MPTFLVAERSLSTVIKYFSSLSRSSIFFLRSFLAAQFPFRCTHALCGAHFSVCSPMYNLCNRSDESLDLLESLGVSKDESNTEVKLVSRASIELLKENIIAQVEKRHNLVPSWSPVGGPRRRANVLSYLHGLQMHRCLCGSRIFQYIYIFSFCGVTCATSRASRPQLISINLLW